MATTRACTRQRANPSSVGVISVTITSYQEFASTMTEPATTPAARMAGRGCPSADWTNRSTSSVRCTTASPRKRRFLSVRVVSNGQKTRSCSPKRTPIAAQLTTPSLPVVVTTVSISGTWSVSSPDKAEQLLARARIVAQRAAQRRGHGPGAGFQYAADGHARMLGAEHHPDTPRLQLMLQPVGDLHGHAFLQLEIAGEHVNDTCQLRQTDDPLSWQIRHVGLAEERQQMMHAERVERDVPHDDKLFVTTFGRERGRGDVCGRDKLAEGGRNPARRSEQIWGVDIRADRAKQLERGPLRGSEIELRGVDDPSRCRTCSLSRGAACGA